VGIKRIVNMIRKNLLRIFIFEILDFYHKIECNYLSSNIKIHHVAIKGNEFYVQSMLIQYINVKK